MNKAPPATFCGLSREAAVLCSVLLSLEELTDRGLVTGPKPLSEEGRKAAADLRASGFEPTAEEIDWGMSMITRACLQGLL